MRKSFYVFDESKAKPDDDHVPMRYYSFDPARTGCLHAIVSDRAYAAIVSSVLKNGRDETGGVLLGRLYHRVWYIVDAIDSGIDTVNTQTFFQWDQDYVNHLAETTSAIYKYPLTILGFWHRHPGSMDYFSATDEITIKANLRLAKNGLLSMLVNIDPEFRMTFYYCQGNMLMKINYDHGDEYFPPEYLEYSTPQELISKSSTPHLVVTPHRVLQPETIRASQKQIKNGATEAGTRSESVAQDDNQHDGKDSSAESIADEVARKISPILEETKETLTKVWELIKKIPSFSEDSEPEPMSEIVLEPEKSLDTNIADSDEAENRTNVSENECGDDVPTCVPDTESAAFVQKSEDSASALSDAEYDDEEIQSED